MSAEHAFRGIDHIALTVTDPARSRDFYVDVLGFTAALESEDAILCLDKGTGFTLALIRHDPPAREPFSHERTGLDHLGLAARDREELEAWSRHLTRHGVDHDPIRDERLGHHLHVHDPDGIALELFAPNAFYAGVRAELLSRPFSDDEVRARAREVLGLAGDDVPA